MKLEPLRQQQKTGKKRKRVTKGKKHEQWMKKKRKLKVTHVKLVKKRKRGSNLKGRVFRKSRKHQKCKNVQPLSQNPWKFNLKQCGVSVRKKTKPLILSFLPDYLTETHRFCMKRGKVINRVSTKTKTRYYCRWRMNKQNTVQNRVDMTTRY